MKFENSISLQFHIIQINHFPHNILKNLHRMSLFDQLYSFVVQKTCTVRKLLRFFLKSLIPKKKTEGPPIEPAILSRLDQICYDS